jgi:hypothetical protein
VQVVEVVEGDEGGGGEGFFQAAAGESSGSGSGSGSGQARRRGKQSADEGAGSRQRSYLEVQGDFLGGAGYDCKERFSPGVDEATHLLLGEEGEERRATKTDDTEDCCKKNWGYLVISAVFVMAFYAISNRDKWAGYQLRKNHIFIVYEGGFWNKWSFVAVVDLTSSRASCDENGVWRLHHRAKW